MMILAMKRTKFMMAAVVAMLIAEAFTHGQAPAFPQGDAVVRFRWNPNSESDLAGYRIYWGTNSMAPQFVRDIPPTNTTATITFPSSVPRWFVYVTAYNNAGLQSDPSTELTVSKPSKVTGGSYVVVVTTTTNIVFFP